MAGWHSIYTPNSGTDNDPKPTILPATHFIMGISNKYTREERLIADRLWHKNTQLNQYKKRIKNLEKEIEELKEKLGGKYGKKRKERMVMRKKRKQIPRNSMWKST